MGVEKMRFGNNKQYIELREGNNYPLIAGMCFVLILLVALFTSKLWLPDNRYLMKFEPESEMMFSLASVTLPKEVYFDENKDLLEFDMKQMSMSKDKSFSLKMSVKLESNAMDLPFEEIKGNPKQAQDNETKVYQDEIVQIRVPETWYYVTVYIEQENAVTQAFTIDYREVKHRSISDKQQDYVINLENAEMSLESIRQEVASLDTQIKDIDTQISSIDTSISKEKDKKKKEELNKQKQQALQNKEQLQNSLVQKQEQIKEIEAQVKTLKGL